MKARNQSGKIIFTVVVIAALITASILGISFYFSSSSIHSLLTENHKLNKAIRNLTAEQQIGYASLVSQSNDGLGNVQSLVKFVQTAPENPDEIVSEQLFPINGNIVHFDALIVKFSSQYVQDGKGRALYLWRRIYGENTAPGDGMLIEAPGERPERYSAITKSLRLKNQLVFWDAIWGLANNPKQLSEYGVSAVYGNAIYTKMEPGKVYVFKISATGQIYPELVYFE
ncbi:MAG: hypothetical protein AAF065_10470 [Verrucomicrobiota bacterium]